MARLASLLIFSLLLGLWTPAVQAREEPRLTMKEFLPRIRGESERHNYKKVIELYEQRQGEDSEEQLPLVVRVLYAQALAGTGQIDEAIKRLQEIVSEVPAELDYLRLQYDLANLLLQQGKKQEAKKAYEQLLLRANAHSEMVTRSRERVAKMNGRDAKKKDEIGLQLLDIETALDAGQVPDGSKEFLKGITKRMPDSPQAETAGRLLEKVHLLENEKVAALLNEARGLFDREKKYAEVREILESILKDYPDASDIESVQVLMKETTRRLGR